MLFATTELAARIERVEAGLMADSGRAVERSRPAASAMVLSLAGGVATYAGEGSPLNKVAGLGFEGPVSVAELEEVERLYAERGSPVHVELSCLADPSIGALLTGRGYRLVGFENVLGRELSDGPAGDSPGLDIRASDEADFDVWLDAVVTGFLSPNDEGLPAHESFAREALEQAIGDMAGAEGFLRYLARRDGNPAGGASMRLGEGVAQLCGAATVPAHRRRGVQAALLAHRLAVAARAGCDVAVVTTQPGSLSQRNVQRNGFELLYTRAVLMLEARGVE
ncbi:MAG: GNAT family N-acetyltransferase [Gemmatimonadota bacterium]